MDGPGLALAALAVLSGWLGPGLAVSVWLVRDPLERLALAWAIGRLLLAGATLLATSTGGAGLLVPWAVAGALAGAIALRAGARRPRGAPWMDRSVGNAIGVTLLAAALLVAAVVGRSGLGDGDPLVFFGRDSTNDPIVYGAIARRLAETGLPLTNPFAGGAPVTGSYVPFAVLAGLASLGASWLDLLFRVAPFVEAAGLGITTVALLRALGAPPRAWLLAPPLLLLGGDPAAWLQPIGTLLGHQVTTLDSWAFFGPYLLAFNPIAAGLQTLFAALLLVRRSVEPGPGRARALAAGLLVAALFEVKLFLWAPALAGLGIVAAWRPPAAAAARLRLAAAAALLGSLPSLAEKAWWALTGAGDSGGFGLCPGCLPRYLADASWGSGAVAFASFREFRASAWLDPTWAAATLAATALFLAVALGARAVAIPRLLRPAPDGVASVQRVVLVGAGVGLLLAATVATPPHYLNAAQFAWLASYGLWPWVACAVAGWLAAGRWVPVALVALLALPGSLDGLVRLGWGAQPSLAIPVDEQRIAAALAADAPPDAVVLEPSMLLDPDDPSPLPLLSGRPVYLSLLSHALYLPDPERDARFANVATVFTARDLPTATAALSRIRAAYLYVPARSPLPYTLPPSFTPLLATRAGTLYRLPPDLTP